MIKRMLDLYCGAGGAAMGYYQAFGPQVRIVGVDIKPQNRYPFEFIQADALEFMRDGRGDGFDFYHASPPCQKYSFASKANGREYPDLIAATRQILANTEKPYVIENVAGARSRLHSPIMLCGSMFRLRVWRHRYFECHPFYFLTPACQHKLHPKPIDVSGTGGHWNRQSPGGGSHRKPKSIKQAQNAMGIDWMTRLEINQAIPPAYTEWIGHRILEALRNQQLDKEERQQIRYDYNTDFVEAMNGR